MENKKRATLVLGIVLLMVGMSFAATPGGADENALAPTVTKTVSPDMIWFGSTETKSTVTIEVTGDDGTTGSTITPIDVVFAIDSSGSMTWNDPDDDRLDAAASFLANLDNTRDTAGVVSWDDGLDFAFGLTDDFDNTDGVEYWIYQVDSSGGTNLNVGLSNSVSMLDSTGQTGSIKIIIFLTDGEGTYSYYGNGGPVDDAADAGYIIYSIGLGGVGSGPLEDMADATGGTYYDSADSSNLDEIYGDIYEEIVTSIALYDVDVVEIVQDYFTVCYDTIDPVPDYFMVNLDGTTTIKWYDVGQYAGDMNSALTSEETATLMFDVKATKAGFELPVQVLPGAYVQYDDIEGTEIGTMPIPQAYISVGYSAELIAGGGNEASAIDVGEVFAWQDEDYLYVKYVTEDGWEMTETHLHVAGDVADFPQTKKGNPKVGQFDYSTDHNPAVDEFEYMVPLDEAWGDTFYIAAHAVVQKIVGYDVDGYPIYQMETAWGDGCDFEGNSWATYMKYVDP